MSRGKVFLQVIANPKPVRYFDRSDLFSVQPFTIVMMEQGNLYECRWDGEEKFFRQLRNSRPHIWSSATLYSQQVMQQRERQFASFLNGTPHPTQDEILHFHQSRDDSGRGVDIFLQDHGSFRTVSIASILLVHDRASMRYLDLTNQENCDETIFFDVDRKIA